MDQEKMERGIRTFLEGLDQSFPGDDQEKTAARVARAWVDDLVSGYAIDPAQELTWTPAQDSAGVVFVRGIEFASVCVHHLLPFFGTAHVAYLPGERQAGLSKIGRVVDAHARRLQTQERLTANIVGTLTETLKPRGVAVFLEAKHTCMTLRGVRKTRSRMVTVETSGLYTTDAESRREILDLLTRAGTGPMD